MSCEEGDGSGKSGRERALTEKGKHMAVENLVKKFNQARGRYVKLEKEIMELVSVKNKAASEKASLLYSLVSDISGYVGKLSDLVGVDDILVVELFDKLRIIKGSMAITKGSVENMLESIEVSSKSSRNSKYSSSKKTSSSSASTLMFKAELELRQRKLDMESQKRREERERRKLELELEEKRCQEELELRKAEVAVEISRKIFCEQELGSDDPGDDCILYDDKDPGDDRIDESKESGDEHKIRKRKEAEKFAMREYDNINHAASKIDDIDVTQGVNHNQHGTSERVLELLLEQNAPGVNIESFSGNPLDFRMFRTVFEMEVLPKVKSSSGRLHRLMSYLKGTSAFDMVMPYVYDSVNGYHEAMKMLKEEYEKEQSVSNAYQKELREFSNVRDGAGLKRFSTWINKVKHCLKNSEFEADLNSCENLRRLAQKLPHYLQIQWNRRASEISEFGDQRRKCTFEDFKKFIDKETRIANNPSFGSAAMDSKIGTQSHGNAHGGQQRNKSFVTCTEKEQNVRPREHISGKCRFCGMKNHQLDKCYKFRRLGLQARKRYIIEANLCFGCLELCERGHSGRTCRRRLKCSICSNEHPSCLHEFTEDNGQTERDDDGEREVVTGATGARTKGRVILNNVVGEVKFGGRRVKTICFLDTMSDCSYITMEVCKKLGISVEMEDIVVSTINGKEKRRLGRVSGLKISDANKNVECPMDELYVVEKLPLDYGDMAWRTDVENMPHLRHIASEIPELDKSVPIGMLIGNDHAVLVEPHGFIRGNGQTYGVKTILGWSVAGPMEGISRKMCCLYTNVQTVTESGALLVNIKDQETDGMLKNCFERLYENEFVEKIGSPRSQEDDEFMDRLSEGTRFVEGKYCIPLPFRGTKMPEMEDNRVEALKAALYFRTRLSKNEEERDKIVKFMTRMKDKGYCRQVPETQLQLGPGKRNYLTYHSVKHPKKPEKTRVVFNCAKKFGEKGLSFNDMLMSGPAADLCNNMVGVQIRWRQEDYAFTADMEDMFYKNTIPEDQTTYTRFFWWKNDKLEGSPVEMQMLVHLFGAKSSPACANFAMKMLADDFKDQFSDQCVETVKQDFYVDDLCKSCPDVVSARSLAKEVKAICGKAGHNLTKFCATDPEVLAEIPREHWAELKVEEGTSGKERFERVLGIKWLLETDEIETEVAVKGDNMVSTKRQLLSDYSGITYDPCGLMAPFFLEGKRLMQEVSGSSGWDEEIDPHLKEVYLKWRGELQGVKLPRCFKPRGFEPVTVQLHGFSDACEYGYGCCIYLRLEDVRGNVSVSLVAGKSRVIPRKGETIPRAELEAARLCSQLIKMVQQELTYAEVELYCYTDSTVVLSYIRNTERKFKTYVANRVRDIVRAVGRENVYFVSSENNPADDASRGLRIGDARRDHRWFTGPDFLKEKVLKNDLVSRVEQEMTLDLGEDKEVKKKKVFSTKMESKNDDRGGLFWQELLKDKSDWYAMKFRVASLIGLVRNYKAKERKPVSVNVEMLQEAENRILRHVQREAYAREIEILLKSKDSEGVSSVSLPKGSALARLKPYIDENGLLRQDGRVRNTDVEFDIRNPIILPKFSRVVDCLVQDCHEKIGHGGRGFTMMEVRSRGFNVIHLNAKVRQLVRRCVICRKQRGDFGEQRMADLPTDRVEKAAPFTYCGMDVFGPFITRNGRKNEKRYGLLITDLVYRGVHLEMLENLDTSSCMNALTRFMNRRGNVRLIRSDNGKNFIGARNEIRKCFESLAPELKSALLKRNCDFEWRMNVPYASHHGGVFERQIGTVRRVLNSIMCANPSILTDESFRTLLTEVEAVVNSRPLTVDTISEGGASLPLSPGNFLTQKSKLILPIFGRFDSKGDMISKKQWRRVKHMAESFWNRFQKEYLSVINQRPKWQNLKRNFVCGDVVLIKDESVHRNDWPCGKIVEAHKSNDGLTRSVKLRLARADLKDKVKFVERPISKLVLLVENVNNN